MPHETHSIISPAILYFGTPVVLITSTNPDGTTSNICAISSVFWLGHRCILGFGAESATPVNILRTGECVVNIAHDGMAGAINALASTTGTEKPSAGKLDRGYRYVKDKWTCSGLTPQESHLVKPSRIMECPVQMECRLSKAHPLMEDIPDRSGAIVAIELQVERIHVIDELRLPGHANRINPDKVRNIFMVFQELYGMTTGQKAAKSSLARVDEEKYRMLTRSDVVTLPGDEAKEIAEKEFQEEVISFSQVE